MTIFSASDNYNRDLFVPYKNILEYVCKNGETIHPVFLTTWWFRACHIVLKPSFVEEVDL